MWLSTLPPHSKLHNLPIEAEFGIGEDRPQLVDSDGVGKIIEWIDVNHDQAANFRFEGNLGDVRGPTMAGFDRPFGGLIWKVAFVEQ